MNFSYLYVYDQALAQARYLKPLAKLEGHLLEIGIKGRISRLNPLKNLREVVDEAVRQGVQTIIAVGTDATFSQVVNAAAHLPSLVLGFIPATTQSAMARLLGLPPLEAGADVISARIIKSLDIGKINGAYFVDTVTIPANSGVSIAVGRYSLEMKSGSYGVVCNAGYSILGSNGRVFNPTDGILDLVILGSKRHEVATRLPATRLTVKDGGEAVSLEVDGYLVTKTPAIIEVLPRKIRVIVGSDRLF